MQYLITDAWNGEGYSESDIEILEVDLYPSGIPKTDKLREKLLKRIIGFGNLKSIEIDESSITYRIDNDCQDAGTFHYEPLTKDILAVAIFPNVCEHLVIRDQETLENYKSLVREAMQEDDWEFNSKYDDSDIYGYVAHAKGIDESDLILREV